MDVTAAIAALGAVVLERLDDGTFQRRSKAPRWWSGSIQRIENRDAALDICDIFPFLEVFLPDAKRVWTGSSAPISSELWTQTVDGREIHLQAFAMRVDDAPALLIIENDLAFADRQLLLQRARELRLTYDALMREIERKDILLHTIVHDLTAPLHSIVGALSLLCELPLPNGAARWTQIAGDAAARQSALIRDILDVFVTERGGFPSPVPQGVNLGNAVQRAVMEREPVARQRQIEMSASVDEHLLVVADEMRLIRVLTNLIDNAIKATPPGTHVSLAATAEGDTIRLTVDDEGPGVAPDVLSRLFQKLGRDPLGGGSGLGLYFCRITVEQWGGGIGYEARATGGSRFWIRVRRTHNGQAASAR
jgi:signal transduction histidine kinase